jgi:hypothetical protein
MLDDDPGREARRTTTQSETQATDTPTTETQTTETQTTETQTTETFTLEEGQALNGEGFALMQRSDYRRARPVLQRAVRALRNTGNIHEAYATYNLAYTKYQLGECNGILPLLDRSETVQGEHPDINWLYDRTYRRCVTGDSDGDDD